MKTKLHAAAGAVAMICIAVFWGRTVAVELFGTPQEVAEIKAFILRGLLILIPAMAIVGASGMALGRRRKDAMTRAKKRRMPIIALNGLVILVPCAIFLALRAGEGRLDEAFYAVQAVELCAGAINFVLLGFNFRDGLRLSRRRAHAAQ